MRSQIESLLLSEVSSRADFGGGGELGSIVNLIPIPITATAGLSFVFHRAPDVFTSRPMA